MKIADTSFKFKIKLKSVRTIQKPENQTFFDILQQTGNTAPYFIY